MNANHLAAELTTRTEDLLLAQVREVGPASELEARGPPSLTGTVSGNRVYRDLAYLSDLVRVII